ncbi:MAG TPA: helix-turn-helix transcriptional regulator [Polyangium sp.]|nr:helix-turn-helix transcriptional regulator [Polyangium sp.]
MKTQFDGSLLAAHIATRIRELQAKRGISEEALVEGANLSSTEIQLLKAKSALITRDMLNRIAAVFGVHPAVLCMDPEDDPLARLLEAQRDLPKDKFQKFAAELISKGFYHSKGLA